MRARSPSPIQARVPEEDPLPPEDGLQGARCSDDLDLLYRSRSTALMQRLRRLGANRDDSLDVVHEAFSRLLRQSPLARSRVKHLESYVARSAQNTLIDEKRSRATRSAWFEDSVTTSPAHADPVTYLESRDMLRRLEAAVARLRPRTREVFLARRVHGHSYAEISAATGLSAKAIEKHMSKAIAKLSRLMDRG